MAAKAHHRSDTLHTAAALDWAKGIFIFNGIDKHASAGTRVEFGGAGDLEGGHIF
jgi:hypothetical protein